MRRVSDVGHEPAPMDGRVRQVELLISRLLRTGVLASLALIVAGTALTFLHHPAYLSDRAALDGLTGPQASFPHTIPTVMAGVADLRGQAIVALGLLVLIATPVLRVAVSIATFAYQRDRTFVAVTTAVLFLLLLSFALGRAGA